MLDDFRSIKDASQHEGFGEGKQAAATQKKIGIALSVAAIFLGVFLLFSSTDTPCTTDMPSTTDEQAPITKDEQIQKLQARLAKLEAQLAKSSGAYVALSSDVETKEEKEEANNTNTSGNNKGTELESNALPSHSPTAAASHNTQAQEGTSDALKKLIAQELQQEMSQHSTQSSIVQPTTPPTTQEKPLLPTKTQSKPAVKATAQPAAKTYTVQRGDTLSTISQKVYGTAKRWKEIAQVNKDKVTPDNQVKVGTTLTIP